METPFIKKVKKILQDPENAQIISWNDDKTMIEIRNQKVFEQKILSRNFRHNRISSFIRQLNLYGFKKIRSAQNRTFTHPLLQKGFPLDVIINKKNKVNHSNTNNVVEQSVHVQQAGSKQPTNLTPSIKKQLINEHRISSNLFTTKQNQKEQKIQFSTTNTISAPQPSHHTSMIGNVNMNTIWLIPMTSMSQHQQQWKFPFVTPQQSQINLNYNIFPAWC